MLPAEWVTALRTLTVFPVPGKEARNPAGALPWFPVVGLLIGFLLWSASWCLLRILPQWPEATALLLFILLLVSTGALHLDGLGDVADAIGSRASREKALAIMKDPRVGSFGALALLLAGLGYWLVFTRLTALALESGCPSLHWIAFPALSRLAMVHWSVQLPYARSEGGTGAPFIDAAGPRHARAAWIIALFATLVLLGPAALFWLGFTGIGIAIGAIFFRRRYGGITGDMLGAGGVCIELASFFLAAAFITHFPWYKVWEAPRAWLLVGHWLGAAG